MCAKLIKNKTPTPNPLLEEGLKVLTPTPTLPKGGSLICLVG